MVENLDKYPQIPSPLMGGARTAQFPQSQTQNPLPPRLDEAPDMGEYHTARDKGTEESHESILRRYAALLPALKRMGLGHNVTSSKINLWDRGLKDVDDLQLMDEEAARRGDPFALAWRLLKMGNAVQDSGPMRQLDSNPADPQRDVALQNDMESFYDEAHKEVDTHHKKRQGKRKKLDEMAHRKDKQKVDDWYSSNHPDWFKTFDKE